MTDFITLFGNADLYSPSPPRNPLYSLTKLMSVFFSGIINAAPGLSRVQVQGCLCLFISLPTPHESRRLSFPPIAALRLVSKVHHGHGRGRALTRAGDAAVKNGLAR